MPFRTFRPDMDSKSFAPQDCALLELPAELRNNIYEFVCLNIQQMTVIPGPEPELVDSEHPLSRTCRQLRAEFLSMYRIEAPRNAQKLICHLKNFDRKNRKQPMLDYLESLPPLPDNSPRTFEQRLFLDNNFKRASVFHDSSILPHPCHPTLARLPPKPVVYTVIANFDSRNFDVEYLREYINRFANPGHDYEWPLYWALRHAIDRHYGVRDEKLRANARKKRPWVKVGKNLADASEGSGRKRKRD